MTLFFWSTCPFDITSWVATCTKRRLSCLLLASNLRPHVFYVCQDSHSCHICLVEHCFEPPKCNNCASKKPYMNYGCFVIDKAWYKARYLSNEDKLVLMWHILKALYYAALNEFHDQIVAVCFWNVWPSVFSLPVRCYVRPPSKTFWN